MYKSSKIFYLIICLMLCIIQVTPAFAHGGEDHGDEKENSPSLILNVENTGSKLFNGKTIEVLVKYPEIHTNIDALFKVFITDIKTNKPVSNANVSFYFESKDSSISPIKLQATETNILGVYQANVTFEKKSNYRMLLGINKDNIDESFSIESILVENISEPSENTDKNSLLPVLIILLIILLIIAIYLFTKTTKSLTVKDIA